MHMSTLSLYVYTMISMSCSVCLYVPLYVACSPLSVYPIVCVSIFKFVNLSFEDSLIPLDTFLIKIQKWKYWTEKRQPWRASKWKYILGTVLKGHHRPLLCLFKPQYRLTISKISKMVHLVSGIGIRAHNLLDMSLLL